MKSTIAFLRNDPTTSPTHLAVLRDQQNHIWQARLFDLMPEARYVIRVEFKDSMARKYLGCVLAGDQDITSKSFAEVVHAAMNEDAGIAIISDLDVDKAPDATLRWGAVWAYMEYHYLGGAERSRLNFQKAIAIDSKNPLLVESGDKRDSVYAIPHLGFFPPYVAMKIVSVIKPIYPDADPSFCVITQPRYIAGEGILLNLNLKAPLPADEQTALVRHLCWYLPPYLPLLVR